MATGRDKAGRLLPGHGLKSPGRKPRQVEERYFELLKKSVTDKDWSEIIERAMQQAKKGDGMARKFLADYLIGPPPQRFEHSGSSDGGPILIRVVRE